MIKDIRGRADIYIYRKLYNTYNYAALSQLHVHLLANGSDS